MLNICWVVLFAQIAKKMRVYYLILVLFGFYSSENCFAHPWDDGEPGDSTPVGNIKLISQDRNGQCTFEITKYERKAKEVPYQETETFTARCRGHYYSRCINERITIKHRLENRTESIKTHERKCCTGYTPAVHSPNDECEPICDPACEFGTCTAPQTCTCDENYTKHQTETNICIPRCDGCEHGVCLVPNLCQCNQNYDWDPNLTECVPICSGDCSNGQCVAPEQCVCDPGFIHNENENICIPHCMTPCENGICIRSDNCVCNDGYRFANESNYICEPICEIECINSKCIEPNTCECESGYIAHDVDKPHECTCGTYCAEIDGKCHCLDAKQRVNVKDFDNDALCRSSNCANGYCKSPTQCECFAGFEKDENAICTPANEICVGSHCGETDVPSCDCFNGICSSNGTCICLNGFHMAADRNDRCEPHCSKECVNGICDEPETCRCENENDYRLSSNETEWICRPICDRDIDDVNGCYNGTCIAPGVCKCFDGYELDAMTNFTCKRIHRSCGLLSKTQYRVAIISIIVLVAILLGVTYILNTVHQRKALLKRNFALDDPRRPIAHEISTNEL